jgi:effector-binding domain-containing protein
MGVDMAAYNRALEYVGARGLRINGRCRELYLNDPQTVPENDLMTEIQIPVE